MLRQRPLDDTRRRCPDCGVSWQLDDDTRRWFEERNLNLPYRCLDCRRARRDALSDMGQTKGR